MWERFQCFFVCGWKRPVAGYLLARSDYKRYGDCENIYTLSFLFLSFFNGDDVDDDNEGQKICCQNFLLPLALVTLGDLFFSWWKLNIFDDLSCLIICLKPNDNIKV